MDGGRWRLMIDQNAVQTAGCKIGSNLPGWHPDDSGTLLCCRYKGIKTVYPKPTRYSDFAFLFVVLVEAPFADTWRIRKPGSRDGSDRQVTAGCRSVPRKPAKRRQSSVYRRACARPIANPANVR